MKYLKCLLMVGFFLPSVYTAYPQGSELEVDVVNGDINPNVIKITVLRRQYDNKDDYVFVLKVRGHYKFDTFKVRLRNNQPFFVNGIKYDNWYSIKYDRALINNPFNQNWTYFINSSISANDSLDVRNFDFKVNDVDYGTVVTSTKSTWGHIKKMFESR